MWVSRDIVGFPGHLDSWFIFPYNPDEKRELRSSRGPWAEHAAPGDGIARAVCLLLHLRLPRERVAVGCKWGWQVELELGEILIRKKRKPRSS